MASAVRLARDPILAGAGPRLGRDTPWHEDPTAGDPRGSRSNTIQPDPLFHRRADKQRLCHDLNGSNQCRLGRRPDERRRPADGHPGRCRDSRRFRLPCAPGAILRTDAAARAVPLSGVTTALVARRCPGTHRGRPRGAMRGPPQGTGRWPVQPDLWQLGTGAGGFRQRIAGPDCSSGLIGPGRGGTRPASTAGRPPEPSHPDPVGHRRDNPGRGRPAPRPSHVPRIPASRSRASPFARSRARRRERRARDRERSRPAACSARRRGRRTEPGTSSQPPRAAAPAPHRQSGP